MELEGSQQPAGEPVGQSNDPAPRDRTETIVRRSGTPDAGRPVTPSADTPPQPGGGDEGFELLEGDPDRYTNKGEHARGGLGRVLRARDHRLGRTVAIKELLQQSDAGESRFVREALITARLQHPGVVPVHEAGRWPNGEPYYVMKLISGRSMKELIRDCRSVSQRLALLPNVIAVAEAIAYAHSEGVIHRDIKPANVVVGEYGETVVVDWGIAKDRSGQVAPPEGEVEGSATATHTAGVLGTPSYMPPEQANGEDVDERADVYALGALLYEVLAGAQPYSDADSGDVLARVLAGPPAPLEELESGVPRDLLAVVGKAMARDPRDRYRSAKELAEDLKRFQTGQLVTAHDYSTVTLLRRWMWRNRALVGVAVAAFAVVAVLGSLAVSRVVDERNLAQVRQTQAEEATRSTEKRRRQLLLLQARSSLDRDPTAAVAWLKTYPEDADGALTLRSMVDEAESLGVARHVLRLGDWGYDIAFSPDSKLVATASNDKKVRVFEVATGAGRELGSVDGPAHSVAFSPDGRHLISGTDLGEVALWDLTSGEHASVQGHDKFVTHVGFSPSGKFAVSLGERSSLRVWDVPALKAVYTRQGAAGFSPAADAAVVIEPKTRAVSVYDIDAAAEKVLPTKGFEPAGYKLLVAVASGGEHVAVFDDDGAVWHHAAPTGWRVLGHHEGSVDNLQFSATGRYVATMGFDKTIRLFSVDPAASGKERETVLRGHLDAIYMLAFSPDDRYALSAGDDATARVWDVESGDAIRVLRGHDDDVYRVAVSPDGAVFGTVSLDGTARLWNGHFEDRRRLRQGATVAGIVWVDDSHLLAHDWMGGLTMWNVQTRVGTQVAELARPGRNRNGGAVSRDLSHAAGVGRDEASVLVWAGDDNAYPLAHDSLRGPSVWGFTPDNRHLLVTYRKGGVVLWDLSTRAPRIVADGEFTGAAALSPDGREVALFHGGSVTIWDLAEEKEVFDRSAVELGASASFVGHMLAYSRDRRWLGLVCLFGEIALIDRRDGTVRILDTGEDKLTYATFSDDGRYVAGSGADRTVRVWRIDTGEQKILPGHTDLVHRVAFSPDGNVLASASYDKTVRLWDPVTGISRVLRGHTASVDSIAFSPDGTTLASGSRDKTVRLWDVKGALGTVDAAAVRKRMRAITSAVIAPDDRPQTLAH